MPGSYPGAVYLFMKSRALKESLYSLPVTEFLTAAEKRLTYFRLSRLADNNFRYYLCWVQEVVWY
ncbi:MAG: hypothetical protein MZV63_56850 [Marinilabiliales bacterium]|nr:hypothetical protein [Marinilabiliales bacterium]